MSKERILVTGGCGYIGSHTVIELLLDGKEVIIIDDLSNSESHMIDRIEKITGLRPTFYRCDVSDYSQLRDTVTSLGNVDGLIHFAAKKAVGESVEKPLQYYNVNITGLINILNIALECEISKFIFSSSCTVYGQPDSLPVTENTPVIPAKSPYGNTKQIGEEIIQDTVAAHPTFNAISLRYFNPVGAHPSGLIGELPLGPPNNLMPYITQTAIGLRKELKVFGSDYDTKDGTAVRDYIHVVDVSQAHVEALARLLQKSNDSRYEVYNLGTGHGSTVLEVITSFEKTSGMKLPYTKVERRSGDVEAIYGSPQKANDILKWSTKYNLDDMTRTAWVWEQNLRNEME